MTAPSNDAWIWVRPGVLHAVHDEQLAEHGGATGLRDASLFDSALARPIQLAASGEPDAAALAAAYGFGLARSHPFVDGDKRTAFVAVELFLALNGGSLEAGDVDCVVTMLRLAAANSTSRSLRSGYAKRSALPEARYTPRARSCTKRFANAANAPASSASRTSRIRSR